MSYQKRNLWIAIFCIIFTGLSVWSGCAKVQPESLREVVNFCKSNKQSDMVLCLGLEWLFAHPVDLKGDGFLELGEELNLFYKLYLLTDNSKEKRFFKDYMISRIDYLLDEHDLKIDYAGEITAYLNFAKIMKRLEIKRPSFFKFIEEQVLDNPMTYPPSVTYAVLNSALVEDIGYPSKIPFSSLVNRGIIVRFARHPELIPIGKAYASPDDIMNFFYDITHEVFAVSNFGDRDPKRFLLDHEVEFLRNIIEQGVTRYIEKGQLDILAELIVCAKMLDHTQFPAFDEGIKFILNAQKKDGSFGVIERMAYLGRPNLYRHGVLVALWALIQ